MTVLFLGESNVPTYMASSTDIGFDGKIIGITLVGKVVYLVDNHEWKYTDSNLVLQDYINTGGGGVTRFTQLVDVPNSYAGSSGLVVKVNATEDGLIFDTSGTGTVTPTGSISANHLAVFNDTTGNVIKDGGAIPATGVARSGSTTDGHMAVWNGSDADSIKDGGAVPPSIPTPPSDATQFLNGSASPAFAQVKDSDLSTSDITTNNVSITKHGFTPKLPNDATKYLDGTGAFTIPPTSGSLTVQTLDSTPVVTGVTEIKVPNKSLVDNGSGVVTIATFSPYSPDFHPTTPDAMDDEFESGSLDAKWTEIKTAGTNSTYIVSGTKFLLYPTDGTIQAARHDDFYQNAPAGTWKVRAKLTAESGVENYLSHGLTVYDNTSGRSMLFGVVYHDSFTKSGTQWLLLTNGETVINEIEWLGASSSTFYLELEKTDSSTIQCRYSTSGYEGTFIDMGGAQTLAGMGMTAFDRVGLGFHPYTTLTGKLYGLSCDWFRRIS